MKPPLKQGMSDDFQTPPEALLPLMPYIQGNGAENILNTIWEPACGKGNLKEKLEDCGFEVIATDILSGQDFLTYQPDNFDCIITNPPFKYKQQFLERCYQLEKPFALLLPLTTFETAKRQKLFRENGLEVIFMPKRINFETPSGKGSGSWFATAWFTNGLNIGRQLTFTI